MSTPTLKTPHPRRLPRLQEFGLLLVIVLLYLFLTFQGYMHQTGPNWNAFLNLDNQFNSIAMSMSEYAIMAVGMTAVIITGGIDISVGAILGLSALAGATVLQYLPPQAPWYAVLPVALLIPVLVGTACGLANGLMIVALRVHPFVITLGTLSIIQGLCVLWFPASVPWGDREIPQSFASVMDYGFNIGLKNDHLRLAPIIVMLLVVALGAVFLHLLIAGRETYAVGGNPEAARFSGIRVGWVTLRVYILMGLCCGIAAFVHLGRFYAAASNDGAGDELQVIAAAVVGGASLTGGRGTALGALLGTLVICLIGNGVDIMHLSTQYTKIILGAAIVAAASIDRFMEHLQNQSRAAA